MILLFRLSSLLPLVVLHGLGWIMGWLAYAGSPAYRREFRKNAAFGGISRFAYFRAIGEAGKMLAEMPRLWMGRLPHLRWQGDTYLSAALETQQGVLFLTPHLGSFEVTALAYAQRFGQHVRPMTVLFRVPRKPWLQHLVRMARQRPGLATATTTLAGVRQLLRALRQGDCVGLLPDQVPPQQLGVWAPFFGQAAYTMTLSARLAQQTGARVVLAWGERLSWGRGYIIHIEPLRTALDPDLTIATTQINSAMEALILRCPDQYLWGYARYKLPRESL